MSRLQESLLDYSGISLFHKGGQLLLRRKWIEKYVRALLDVGVAYDNYIFYHVLLGAASDKNIYIMSSWPSLLSGGGHIKTSWF